jgi:hypothetical protein
LNALKQRDFSKIKNTKFLQQWNDFPEKSTQLLEDLLWLRQTKTKTKVTTENEKNKAKMTCSPRRKVAQR